MCASSQTTRSQSASASSFAWTSSLRLSLSSRQMTRSFSSEPVAGAGGLELVVGEDLERRGRTSRTARPATARPGCPGQTIRQRCRSPRTISSLMSSPAMIVLPAPGSSASRKRSGWRGSISLVDGGDLVRQRLDAARCGRPGTGRRGARGGCGGPRDEPEQGAVAVEAPGPARRRGFQGRQIGREQDALAQGALRVTPGDLERAVAGPQRVQDGDGTLADQTLDGRAGLDLIEADHAWTIAEQLRGRLRSQGAGSRLRFGWARRCSMSRIMASLTMVSETSGSSS